MRFKFARILISICLLLAYTTAHSDIAILLSDEKSSFTLVADELQKNYKGHTSRYNMMGGKNSAGISKIKNDDAPVIVAIGLQAARYAQEKLHNKHVIFCQVLNPEQFNLTSQKMKGVSALPPMESQLRLWKELDPRISSIGVITGRNGDMFPAEAQAAGSKHGISIVHSKVKTDREVMYAIKRIRPRIQGLWLAPDSSILSSHLITELMTYATKEALQVLVFAPELLRIGGLMSAVADPHDIAQQVLERVKEVENSGNFSAVAIRPLSKVEVEVNEKIAERYGIRVPVSLKGADHDK